MVLCVNHDVTEEDMRTIFEIFTENDEDNITLAEFIRKFK